MQRLFLQTLKEYGNSNRYPWHMPGHKRQMTLAESMESLKLGAKYDVTEVPGLDNLLAPEGVLKESMAQLSKVYGSYRSYYLVNGSSCGILTAISAVCRPGDTLIMGRNCHRSIYHAVALLGLHPVYLYPKKLNDYGIFGDITKEQVQEALKEHPETKAVIFPSPTYEGVVSDVAGISEVVHQNGAYLIVDEAHGAYLEFCVQAPAAAIRCGADLVIESLHKTLPCYNQCAILHVGGNDAEQLRERVERYLQVYQTTSPSYLLVANMEDCIATMDAWRMTHMQEYWKRLLQFRRKWENRQGIHLLTKAEVIAGGAYDYDEAKLVFCIPENGTRITGEAFANRLEQECGQVMEMASLHYVLAMTSVADTEEAFETLDQALRKIVVAIEEKETENIAEDSQKAKGIVEQTKITEQTGIAIDKELKQSVVSEQEQKMIPADAWNQEMVLVKLPEAEGRIAGEYVTVYPPGIPQLVPGESISNKEITYLQQCMEQGLTVQGITENAEILVLQVKAET